MSSFLILSSAADLANQVLGACRASGVRVRQVSSLDHARKWLSLQPHSGVFVDQSYSQEDVISLFIDSWEKDSETFCALISPDDLRETSRQIMSLGVLDCCGSDYVEKIAALISRIPIPTTLTYGQHSAVMVVDDLDSPRSIICTLIESFGFRDVVPVSNVDSALSILGESPFRFFAIVTDLNMPGRSGHSLIDEVRETLAIAYLPIIVLTSDPSEENLLKTLKQGITAFIAKPPRKFILKAELEKAKRLVSLGKAPEIGTPDELKLLERSIRLKGG
ncbi:MAG TPA: response regulator [Oligoflexia bacterium]|nr:response regulator [Oligoflexia bacterium]HMP49712.1 response regulator [Oligoflexia bacterium]